MSQGLLPLVALLVTAQLVGPVLGSKLARVGPLVLDRALPITVPLLRRIKHHSGIDVVDHDLVSYNPCGAT